MTHHTLNTDRARFAALLDGTKQFLIFRPILPVEVGDTVRAQGDGRAAWFTVTYVEQQTFDFLPSGVVCVGVTSATETEE